MIKIALLGSTGSIGKQVLNVVDRYPEKFKIVSLSANKNVAVFAEQVNKYKPKIATLTNPENLYQITSMPKETTFYYGENALLHAITEDCDIVFDAVMGFAGLSAVLQAIKLKKDIALANKETLVAGGELVMSLAKKAGVRIIPVDSEHSAIFQCLECNREKPYKKLIITASGGAFRNKSVEELSNVTVSDALLHPTWQMGKKITVDCATMMNKGFEVLEAMWLFNAKKEDIQVVIHPQSIIHSMVEFEDGAILAQMGNPSMELPIQLALTYPERLYTGIEPLNLIGKTLEFYDVDRKKYPCFEIMEKAIEKGGNYPVTVSGADEVAVELFLQGKIKFLQIADLVSYATEFTEKTELSLEGLKYADMRARERVIEKYKKGI